MKDIYFTTDENTVAIPKGESEKFYKALDENNSGVQHAAENFLISLAVYIKNNNIKLDTVHVRRDSVIYEWR